MDNNQSSYNFWTWLVAILLALILLWMLMTGRGPSAACCGAPSAPVAETAVVSEVDDVMPTESAVTPVEAAFSFNASCEEITHMGEASGIEWFSRTDDLKSTLCSTAGGASNITASGSANAITLTGTVDDEATKMQIAQDAQAFFGADTTIDNQIVVNTSDAAMDTPVAKLYFKTASTALPENYDSELAPVIEWLNNHPDSKAAISGYHDPRGNKAMNAELSKNRAKSVYEALRVAGIDESRLEMRKPVETEGGGSLAEARRVEVTVE